METEGTESKIMDVRRAAMKSSAAAYGVSLAAGFFLTLPRFPEGIAGIPFWMNQ